MINTRKEISSKINHGKFVWVLYRGQRTSIAHYEVPVPPSNEDGVDHYLSSGFFGSYVDIEGVYRTEFDLIKRYREMALHPECDSAIEDIVNEPHCF